MMAASLTVEKPFNLDARIEEVHEELLQLLGGLHLVSQNAKKADNETLGFFCDLIAGGIDRSRVMLCDIASDADFAMRGLSNKKGA
jgi:hypothetical protein